MLSNSNLRFSDAVSDAIDYLDEDELDEVTQQIAREMDDN
jgi:hypothetical protein